MGENPANIIVATSKVQNMLILPIKNIHFP